MITNQYNDSLTSKEQQHYYELDYNQTHLHNCSSHMLTSHEEEARLKLLQKYHSLAHVSSS